MVTINKKPTKAHKDKKVVKAHQGMAHVPRPKQRPTAPAFAKDAVRKAQEQMIKRGPLAPTTTTTDTVSKPTRRPTLSGRRAATDVLRPTKSVVDPSKRRPTPSPIKTVYDAPMPTRTTDTVRKPMDERARRRRDNALKSEVDEMTRRFNRQRPRQPTAQPIRQPRLAMPYNPAADNFPIGKPNNTVVRGLGPLRNNFNLQQSTALTDRFNKNNLNQSRLQMQRNKGGDIKKYATGGLNKGMTKSRTKYGTVDNKKK